MTPWRLGHRTVLLLLLLAEKHPVYEVLECSLTPSCSSPRLGLGPVHSSLSLPCSMNKVLRGFAVAPMPRRQVWCTPHVAGRTVSHDYQEQGERAEASCPNL